MICGDILQHFEEFLKVNHPEIPVADVRAQKRVLQERKVNQFVVTENQENLRLSKNDLASTASFEKLTPRDPRQERSRNGSRAAQSEQYPRKSSANSRRPQLPVAPQSARQQRDTIERQTVKHRFISLKKHAEKLKGRQKTEFLCGLVDSSFSQGGKLQRAGSQSSFNKSPRFTN